MKTITVRQDDFKGRVTRRVRAEIYGEAAVHEASHAVACVICGVEVVEVRLGNPLSYCRHGKAGAMAEALISIAGSVGVRIAGGEQFTEASDSDLKGMRLAQYRTMAADPAGFRRKTEAQAEGVLRSNWDFVHRLAAELTAKRRLTGADVERIRTMPVRRVRYHILQRNI